MSGHFRAAGWKLYYVQYLQYCTYTYSTLIVKGDSPRSLKMDSRAEQASACWLGSSSMIFTTMSVTAPFTSSPTQQEHLAKI